MRALQRRELHRVTVEFALAAMAFNLNAGRGCRSAKQRRTTRRALRVLIHGANEIGPSLSSYYLSRYCTLSGNGNAFS
jgi:hypothetical protein